jgi:hypothetical protein
MANCPACHREVPSEQQECPYCGIVFAKWRGRNVLSSDIHLHEARDLGKAGKNQIETLMEFLNSEATTESGFGYSRFVYIRFVYGTILLLGALVVTLLAVQIVAERGGKALIGACILLAIGLVSGYMGLRLLQMKTSTEYLFSPTAAMIVGRGLITLGVAACTFGIYMWLDHETGEIPERVFEAGIGFNGMGVALYLLGRRRRMTGS